jgi:hypothetical protein
MMMASGKPKRVAQKYNIAFQQNVFLWNANVFYDL